MVSRLAPLLLTVAALLFMQCGPHRYPPGLLLLDSLADSRTDSAVALMRRLAPDMGNAHEWDRRYYELLCIKVADKANLPLPTDTAVWQMVAWYEEQGDHRLLPTAYYYASRVCRTQNDAPQALDYLLQAADLLSMDDSQLHLKAVVHSQMGYLFSQQKLYRNAIEAFQEAYRCDSLAKDTTGLIYDLRDIGFNYENVNRRDSSVYYIEKALYLAKLQDNEKAVIMLEPQMANIYQLLGKQKEARATIQSAIRRDDKENQSSIYAIAAAIYYDSNIEDSALLCCYKLINLPSVYAKRAGYRGLSRYFSNVNNIKEAQFTYDRYRQYSDSVDKITATATIAQMNSLYNYKIREKENHKLRKERDESRLMLRYLTFIIFLFIAVSIAAVFFVRYKDLTIKIKLERRKRVDTAIELASFHSQKRHDNNQGILNSEIIKRIKTILNDPDNNNKLLTEEEWNELEKTIIKNYPNFKNNILEVCKLTPFKAHLCLLLKAKFAVIEIAQLTQHSAEAVTSARRRMAQKAFGDESSPADWDSFIDSL